MSPKVLLSYMSLLILLCFCRVIMLVYTTFCFSGCFPQVRCYLARCYSVLRTFCWFVLLSICSIVLFRCVPGHNVNIVFQCLFSACFVLECMNEHIYIRYFTSRVVTTAALPTYLFMLLYLSTWRNFVPNHDTSLYVVEVSCGSHRIAFIHVRK